MGASSKVTLVYVSETDGPVLTYTGYYGAVKDFIERKNLTEHNYMIFKNPPLEGKLNKNI